MTTITNAMTAEDLWNLPRNGRGFELIRGELRPMPPSGSEHGGIAANIAIPLGHYVKSKKLGRVFVAEAGYTLHQNPDSVVAPDVSFVSTARLPAKGLSKKYYAGAPDLAVEVISPSDVFEEVEEKVRDLIAAGTRMVWVASPRHQTLSVYESPTSCRIFQIDDVLTGGGVVPGFELPVREIFDEEN